MYTAIIAGIKWSVGFRATNQVLEHLSHSKRWNNILFYPVGLGVSLFALDAFLKNLPTKTANISFRERCVKAIKCGATWSAFTITACAVNGAMLGLFPKAEVTVTDIPVLGHLINPLANSVVQTLIGTALGLERAIPCAVAGTLLEFVGVPGPKQSSVFWPFLPGLARFA